MGTPYYLSPEQARGEAVDGRTDQYSLGCILYEMLSGKVPFTGDTLPIVLMKHATVPPQPLRELPDITGVPAGLEQIVLRLLAKNREDRFPDLGALEQGLLRVQKQLDGRSGRKEIFQKSLIGIAGASVLALTATMIPRKSGEAPPLSGQEILGMRSQAIATLKQALSSPPPLRYSAISALGQVQAHEAATELGRFESDGDELSRALAARALGMLGQSQGRDRLRSNLRSPNDAVQLQAAYLLCDLEVGSESHVVMEKLRMALGSKSVPQAMLLDVLMCLSHGSEEDKDDAASAVAARAQLAALFQESQSAQNKIPIAARLNALGDEAAHTYLATLATQKGTAQLPAARALASPAESRLAPLFRTTLRSPQTDASARILSSEGLGYSGDLDDLRLLDRMVQTSTASSPEERVAAATAVLRLLLQDKETLSEQSLRWAVAALSDGSWATRAAAVQILAQSHVPEAKALIAGLLADPDVRVRKQLVRALSRSKRPDAMVSLLAALRDVDADVRVLALRGLRRLISLFSGEALAQARRDLEGVLGSFLGNASPVEEILARGLLFGLGDQSQRQILQRMQDSHSPNQKRELIEIGVLDETALEALLRDADPQVRVLAAMKLYQSGNAQAQTVLRTAFLDGGVLSPGAYAALRERSNADPVLSQKFLALIAPERPLAVRLAALEAAQLLPQTEALEILLRGMHDPESEVRSLCAEVAADLALPANAGSSSQQRDVVLRYLSQDPNPAVRARAAALLGRSVTLRPELRRLLSQAAESKKAAPNNIRKESKETDTPVPSAPIGADPDSEVTKTYAAARQAVMQGNVQKAVRLFQRTRILCGGRAAQSTCAPLGGKVALELASLYEKDNSLPEAMQEYEKSMNTAGAGKLPPAQRSEAQKGVVRLLFKLGKVIISTKQEKGCKQESLWVLAGVRTQVKVGASFQPVQVAAGSTTKIGDCP